MGIFEKIAERKILEAIGSGMFKDLQGSGKPIVFEDETCLKKLRELNYKLMKLNILRRKPLSLADFPQYENRIIEKLTSV